MIDLYAHDGSSLRSVPYEGLDHLPDASWLWLDVISDDLQEIAEVGAALGFDPLSIEDVVTDMLPKIDLYDDYRYLVIHGLTFTDDRIDTVEFDLFIADDVLVTFRPGEVDGVTSVRERLNSHLFGPTLTPAALAARIIDAGSRRFPNLIEALEERIEDLEELAMQADNSVIGEALALRRDVIVLRRVFGPQRDVLAMLSRDETLDIGSRRAFADVFDHHFRFVESLDSARALIGSVQETHRGAIAAHTNEVMKVLTVFSAIMLPLTLLTGIWGMNVSLPFAESPAAFRYVVGGMTVLAVGLWLYFARRRFIGGISLTRIPKAVGLTLAHLTAPIRPHPVARRQDDQVRP